MEVQNVQHFFDEVMPQAANNPDKISGMTATYQFIIEGDEGGEWYLEIADDEANVEEGEHDSPDCTITATDENWLKIVRGELNPQMAFMQQKIKIAGKMPLALKLSSFLKA